MECKPVTPCQTETQDALIQCAELLAQGYSQRATARILKSRGIDWSRTKVRALASKPEMRRYVQALGQALVARAVHQAADNQAVKVELGHAILADAKRHADVGNLRAARRVLKESGKFLSLADQVEARMLGMVGLGAPYQTAANLTYLILADKSVGVQDEVLKLLGQLGSSLHHQPYCGAAKRVDGQDTRTPPPPVSDLPGILGDGNPDDGPEVGDILEAEWEHVTPRRSGGGE